MCVQNVLCTVEVGKQAHAKQLDPSKERARYSMTGKVIRSFAPKKTTDRDGSRTTARTKIKDLTCPFTHRK